MSEQNSPQLRTRSTDNISVSDYCSLTNSRESPVSLSPVPFYHSPPRSCSPVYDGINVYTSKNYDIHIKAIRAEQEQVQRKTFKNFINSILPGCIIEDIVDEFRDGVVLSRLIETLTGDKLRIERGPRRRRTHFICTVKSALKYLEDREIKLVNINPSDIVDGKPSIVLGLVWTLILNFYIRTHLAELELYFDDPDGVSSFLTTSPSESPRSHSSSYPKHRIKQILLEKLGEKFGLNVNNFDRAWRDGRAFLSLTDRIVPRLFALEKGNQLSSNRARLAFAFDLAEKHLGIAKLIDPSDVDVPSPDEKSIMTYISQFIPKEITRRKSILTQEDLESITRTLKNTPSSSFSCQDIPHYLFELSSHDIVETSLKIEHKKHQQREEEFQSYQHYQLREEHHKLNEHKFEERNESKEGEKHRKVTEQKFTESNRIGKDEGYQNIIEGKLKGLQSMERGREDLELEKKTSKDIGKNENEGEHGESQEKKSFRNAKSEGCEKLSERKSKQLFEISAEKKCRKFDDQRFKEIERRKKDGHEYEFIGKDENLNGDEDEDKDEDEFENEEDKGGDRFEYEAQDKNGDNLGDEDEDREENENREYQDHEKHEKHKDQRIEITLNRSAFLAAPMLDTNDNEIKSCYDERRTVSAPPTPRRYAIRRRRRQILKTLYGGLKAALPIPFMIFILAGVSTLIPSFEEDFDCVFMNNLRSSLRATLDYPNGPPPL